MTLYDATTEAQTAQAAQAARDEARSRGDAIEAEHQEQTLIHALSRALAHPGNPDAMQHAAWIEDILAWKGGAP